MKIEINDKLYNDILRFKDEYLKENLTVEEIVEAAIVDTMTRIRYACIPRDNIDEKYINY